MLAALFFLAVSCLAGPASAATWYFLRYYTPSGAKFTSLSGEMVIPTLPKAGTYYLWPGLQPTDNSGVYQNVLDGRSGTVSIYLKEFCLSYNKSERLTVNWVVVVRLRLVLLEPKLAMGQRIQHLCR